LALQQTHIGHGQVRAHLGKGPPARSAIGHFAGNRRRHSAAPGTLKRKLNLISESSNRPNYFAASHNAGEIMPEERKVSK